MKRNVILEIPITGSEISLVNLSGPCTYCGKPVNEDGFTWFGEESYHLKKWGISRKWGDHQVYDVEVNGVPQMGIAQVAVPYCSQHKEGVKVYKLIRLALILLGLIASLIVLLMTWSNVTTNSWLDIAIVILFPLFGTFAGFLLSILVIRIIYLFMGSKKDYPTFNKGHWGFTVEGVTVDKGELGIGPIQYYLQVVFLNPESAKRVIEANPGTRIIKGEKLIAG